MNVIGATFTNEMREKVKSHLLFLTAEIQPYLTSEVFINYLEANRADDRIRSAYTSHDWEKLVALKTKYDPSNVFRFNRNIAPEKPVLSLP